MLPVRGRRPGRIAAWAAWVCLLCGGAAFGAPESASRTVRIGHFPMAPILEAGPDSTPQGLYPDIIERIAELENWRIEWVAGTWAEGLAAVRTGEIDLMPLVTYTEEREDYLDFCRESVLLVWGQVFVAPDAPIQSILDLDGRRIALMRDDQNGANFLAKTRDFGIVCTVEQVPSHLEVFRLVAEGRVAAGVAPNVFGYGHGDRFELVATPIVFDPGPTTFAAPEGRNGDLLATIDRYLREWKKDPDSVYGMSYRRWTGQQPREAAALPGWLIWVVPGAFLAALLLLLWIRVLDARVRARTRELTASQAKMRIIFDQTYQFLGLLDTEGRLQEVNRTAVAFVGAEPEDFIGWHFWDCPWWSHDSRVQEEVRQGIDEARRGHVHFGEATHFDADGRPHTIRYTIKPAITEDGQVESLLAEGHDVTSMYELEEGLRRSQRMEAMGTLAGGIAHDFNNILSAVIGYNEMARDEAQEHPRILEYLEQIDVASERARELVAQILAFGRGSENGVRIFSPKQIVAEVARLLHSSLPKTIRIQLEAETDGMLAGNPTHYHQIVMNLATNAYHAMEKDGGLLSLSLREIEFEADEPVAGPTIPAGSYILLAVADTGTGMDPETLSQVFEPYFTTKDPGKGTGLGLAVVRGIVEAADGHLRVQSEPGIGTTFQVYFPMAASPGPTAPARPFSTGRLHGSGRILVVDDETSLAHLVAGYLESLGYRVTTATDGYHAWELLRDEPGGFDLLVADQTMPGLTGCQLVERVRRISSHLPVILCTGYATADLEQLQSELRIRKVMRKPMVLKDLALEVHEALSAGKPLDS